MLSNVYDLIIVGAGPAGLTAALYALRARMNLLVLDKAGAGGQALIIATIENFPSFSENSNGFVWVSKLEAQLKQFDCTIHTEEVVSISSGDCYTVKTDQHSYKTHAVICSTGAEPNRLEIPGEKKFIGKGVSYCATCDAPFFKNKHVVVVGGGDTAVKDAVFLTRFADKLTLVHRRDRLRAEKIIQERLFADSKSSFKWNSIVTEIMGEKSVEKIRIKNVKTKAQEDLSCDGVFILIGVAPSTSFLKDTVNINKQGFIATSEQMETNSPGIFAAGDCRNQYFRQIVTACGDGATAAFAAQHFVDTKLGRAYGEFKA